MSSTSDIYYPRRYDRPPHLVVCWRCGGLGEIDWATGCPECSGTGRDPIAFTEVWSHEVWGI